MFLDYNNEDCNHNEHTKRVQVRNLAQAKGDPIILSINIHNHRFLPIISVQANFYKNWQLLVYELFG